MNIIELKNISKIFGEVRALDDISLSVKKGEWVSIMGPSGSGKSTLVNILSLMDTPSLGEYFLCGEEASRFDESKVLKARKERIGLVFQQFHLIPYLNATQNVMTAQFYHSCADIKSAEDALRAVGLAHRLNHLPSELSGGEQQRVCIARALINEPDIIIADEPTGNLDEANEKVIVELFKELKNAGKTLILITHNEELGKLADRVIRLKFGKIENA